VEAKGCGKYHITGDSFLSLSLFHKMNRKCQSQNDYEITSQVKPRVVAAYSALCHQSLHADHLQTESTGFHILDDAVPLPKLFTKLLHTARTIPLSNKSTRKPCCPILSYFILQQHVQYQEFSLLIIYMICKY
jgi:hypothetical protein